MSEVLWSAKEVAQATGGQLINGDAWKATGFAMDSREVKGGEVFIALKGDAGTDKYRTSGMDGHDFVQSAFESGAVAAIVDHEMQNCSIPQIIVSDTLKAMQDMGQFARDRASLQQAIAVTGSVGKTGTRDLINAAFKGAGTRTHASIKSYNNMFGVPYTLATMKASTDVGVFEVGMNYADEITPLSRQIRPTMAVITSIADVHTENFDNGIDGIVKAKSEVFDGMTSHGIAILPHDNEHYAALVANAKTHGISRIYSFGENKDADARLTDCILAANGTRVTADIMGEEVTYTLQIAGKHIALNSLSALLAVKLSDMDVQQAAKALEGIEPLAGRGTRELIDSGEKDNPITLIDESYNASPVAMNASFRVMAMVDPGRGGRRIAVLGDMLELGARSRELHEGLALPLQAAGVDLLYCSGHHMKSLYDKMPAANQGEYKPTADELAAIIPDVLSPGDVVLVKGSLGSKMKAVVEAMRAMGK